AAEAAAAEAAAAEAAAAEAAIEVSEVEMSDEMPEREHISLDSFLGMESETSELIVSETEAPAAVEETDFVMEDETSVEQVEAVAEPVAELELPGADDALAAMIAAYGEQPSVEPDEAYFAKDEAVEEVAPAAEVIEEGMTVPAQSEDTAVTEAAMADDDYYGMSVEELDALTSPGDTVPMPEAITEDEVSEVAEEAVEEIVLEEAQVEEIQEASEPEPEVAEAASVSYEEELVGSLADESEEASVSVQLAIDPADPDEALDMTDLDPELLDIFLEESGDILDHSDGVLANLREHQSDMALIVDLQRDLHTLKGGARMSGIFAVGELGHSMESLLEAVAEGRVPLNNTGVVVLERGFDRLHSMITRVHDRKALALPSNLIAQFDKLATGQSIELAPEVKAPVKAAPEVSKPEVSKVSEAPVADVKPTKEVKPTAPVTPASAESLAPALKPLSAPTEAVVEEDDGSGVRAPQEQVRIRADLLDKLVNYAGEVAIYRARLEQQLGAFRGALGELGQTTSRLREQLRRLEIETEAQIVARYQREGEETGESFDPLELDRFTTQQQLSRSLSESANDLINLETTLDDLTRQYETLLLQQARVSSDLQEGLMRTRMVPFDALVPRLRRVLRQAATDTGKQVQLKVDGASGEMDRNVLERMTAPLEHMLRNSMAHGLELPADRRKAKKTEEGTVRIVVQREGSEVVLKIIDDGRGLNKAAIRSKAIERGLLAADAEVTDSELYAMILETGFSTAETVSRLSGRGVGMDVVYSEIRQLGGTLQINSDEGKGSEFIIRLPFTLAVTQAVFVKIGETSFAVPIASVQGVGRIGRADLDKQLAGENPVFAYAGEDYAIHDLGRLIGHGTAKAVDSLQMPLLLARSGDLRAAICVDQVMGSKEIVVKPVGPQVNSIPGIFGATIMGDGRVVMILDVAPLVRRYNISQREDAVPVVPVAAPEVRRIPAVMVVDDSITMRKVTGRVLERNNFEVLTAKDGVDAVEKMAERAPDLVLLDIEMPRMDGYEVAQHMRSDPRLKDVPIIMITSRTGDKHRQRAMDIGVDRYLGKPYQENELMRNVFEILGMEPVNG
ncbi:MAG: response regulator, partial [Arenimonas sp.]